MSNGRQTSREVCFECHPASNQAVDGHDMWCKMANQENDRKAAWLIPGAGKKRAKSRQPETWSGEKNDVVIFFVCFSFHKSV